MKIQVTMGICLRNCETDVKQIVGRINEQDFPHENMEVIFVEEGSEDDTLLEIFKHAPKMNPHYEIFHHKWKGLGFSRNVVLNNARGDYLVWVDDGTILPKDYLRRTVDFMEKHLNVGIVHGILANYYGSNRVAALENMVRMSNYNKDLGKYTLKLPATSASVYRVKAARQVGGFDERISGATEDMDIAYQMRSIGWVIFIIPVKYSTVYNEKMKQVWDKGFWYGYGSHFTLHKHKELGEILYKSTPLAGFLQGVLVSKFAYKLTHKKLAFLLPLFFFIKRIAFCLGFIKSHLDFYEY